nr:MarR family winged helix-turn-helix transcriptional regulator [Streptomyces sp. SID14446]
MWSQHVSREITSQQFAVLNALSRQPGVDQRTLARLTSLDRSTVNQMVRRLTDQGHVSQLRDTADRRRTLLELTATGSDLLAALIPPAEAINAQILQMLPEEQRAVTLDSLRRIALLGDETTGGA